MRIASERSILFLCALLVSILGIQPAFGQAIITVNGAGDDLNDGNGNCSIREAVQNANDDANTYTDCTAVGAYGNADIINITQANVTINNGVDIDILDGVTLNGAPTTFDATNASRHFFLNTAAQTVIFNAVSFINGQAGSENGGAIGMGNQFGGQDVIINEAAFTDNTAAAGGAISAIDRTLNIINSTFTNNEATGLSLFNGGGGAIHSVLTDVTITGATTAFTGNAATLVGPVAASKTTRGIRLR